MTRAVLTVLSLAVAALIAPCFCQTPTYSGLSYGPDTANKLDIYMPSGGTQPYPVVVWIHGGGWLAGSRIGGDATNLAAMLGPQGVAVVSIDYRLSAAAKWPAQIHDCKAAIRWIRANADTFHFNPDCVGCAGMSAGGHLAAFLGTSGGVSAHTVGSETMDLEGTVGGNTQYSSSVTAVLDMYGPTDFLTMSSLCPDNSPAISTLDHDAPDSPESILMGAPIQTIPDKCRLANPVTFVDADDPAFLILHGTQDILVPCCNSILLDSAHQQAFATNNTEAMLYLLPGQGHGFSVTVMPDTVVSFFARNLCAGTAARDGGRCASPAGRIADMRVVGPALMVSAAGDLELTVADALGRVLVSERLPASASVHAVHLHGTAAGTLVCAARARGGIETMRVTRLPGHAGSVRREGL